MKKILLIIAIIFSLPAAAFPQCESSETSNQREAVSAPSSASLLLKIKNLEVAAAKGDSAAMFHLSTLLERGFDSIPADSIKARALLTASARRGYPEAQNYLGFKLYKTQPDSALYWLNKAADAGNRTARANLAYLRLQNDSTITPQEALREGLNAAHAGAHPLAFHFYQIAAKGEIPRAWTLIADAYSSAKGVDYNHDRALEYYIKAADAGDPSAQFILAELLEIFPDALNQKETPETSEKSKSIETPDTQEKSKKTETPEPSEKTKDYYYSKAAEQGVTNAREAFERLFE